MKYLFLTGIHATVFLMVTNVPAEVSGNEVKSQIIPLERIWAYEMPGTMDIGELEKGKSRNYKYGPMMSDVRRALATAPPRGKQAPDCFAVLGTGSNALREAHAVFAKNKQSRHEFPAGSEVWVVFFSYGAGSYVHLHSVEREGNTIRVRYRFVPHETREMTSHIAIIPLVSMSEGEVRVEIIQTPMEKAFLDSGFRPISKEDVRRIVCRSSSFTIVSNRKK